MGKGKAKHLGNWKPRVFSWLLTPKFLSSQMLLMPGTGFLLHRETEGNIAFNDYTIQSISEEETELFFWYLNASACQSGKSRQVATL